MSLKPRDADEADDLSEANKTTSVEVFEKPSMRSGQSNQDLPPVPPKPSRLRGGPTHAGNGDEPLMQVPLRDAQIDLRERYALHEKDNITAHASGKLYQKSYPSISRSQLRELQMLSATSQDASLFDILHRDFGFSPQSQPKRPKQETLVPDPHAKDETPPQAEGKHPHNVLSLSGSARESVGMNASSLKPIDFDSFVEEHQLSFGPSLFADAETQRVDLKEPAPKDQYFEKHKTALTADAKRLELPSADINWDEPESEDDIDTWTSPSSTRSASITSIESIANEATQSGRLATITKSLHDDAVLEVIAETARHESALKSEKYQKRLSEMVKAFGKELASEAQAPNERSVAKAMQSEPVSSWTADHLIPRESPQSYHAGPEGRFPAASTNYGSPTRLNDASLDAQTDAGDAQLSPEDIIIRDFVAGSHAFMKWKASLLDFIHKPQEEAIQFCITGMTVGESGSVLSGEATAAIAKEIAWIPPERLTISREVHIALLDRVKGSIEHTMRETWDWWPLPPRQRPLRQGFCRVRWRSPCGEPHHIDIIEEQGEALARVIDHASVFVKNSFQHHAWSERSPRNEGKDDSSIGNVLAAIQKIARMMASPFASTADTATIAQESLSGSSQATDGQPSSTDTGSRLPSQPSTAPTDKNSPVQHQGARATGTPSANSFRGSSNVQSDRSRGAQPSNSSVSRSRHVYICVKSGSHCFCHLSCTSVKNDLDFFAALKTEYLRRRGRMRLWFSMWRYDHCEFYRFHKYGYEVGEPVKMAFPDASDTMYDFEPRPPLDSPPHGPITEGEFRDHFYKDCGTYHSWRRYGREKIFSHLNNEAVKSLPKRIQELEMQDGKREYFYGLYAKERRSAFRVMAYAALCNVPGTLFFFLWLFQWEHASDLQNASVPVMLSLSLTLGFVMLVYESRERR